MSLKGKVDRIIMNLPEKSLDYTDVVCFLMKETGGILHNYQFCEKPKQIEKAIINLKSKLNELKQNLLKRQVLPTLGPPIITILNVYIISFSCIAVFFNSHTINLIKN